MPVRLRERVLADVAEAEFVELAVGQFMQSVDHVVVAALEGLVNAIGLDARPGSSQAQSAREIRLVFCDRLEFPGVGRAV
jgi:hypothetical protein